MRALAALLPLLALAPGGPGHRARTTPGVDDESALPALDPYTEGRPEALARAGYDALGRFPWAAGHDTAAIDEVVGQRLLWVETAHFRLGSSLPAYRVKGDPRERKKLRDELARLGERLDGVKPRARELDPWLRVHLFARRLEDLYAEFAERMGADDEGLELEDGTHAPLGGAYMGQRERFTVLLCAKTSTLGRYTEHFLGQGADVAVHHAFAPSSGLFFGAALAHLLGYDSDSALHVLVAQGVTANLVDGFRGYARLTPIWVRQGLASWFARRVDARWCLYRGYRPKDEDDWRWEPRVRKRVEQRYYPTTEEVLRWDHDSTWGLAQDLVSWSRVDFLMQREGGRPGLLLYELNEPLTEAGPEALAELQRRALLRAFDLEPDAFDAAWAAWVERSYPRR